MSEKTTVSVAKTRSPSQPSRLMQRSSTSGSPIHADSQYADGNQASLLIQRKARSPGAANQTQAPQSAPGAGFNLTLVPVQAKLSISQPGDPYEREADRAADAVMSEGPVARPSISQYHAASPELPDLSPVTKDSGEQAPQANEPGQMSNLLQRGQSSGETLPLPLRTRMENRFGADFSAVRLHTDSNAARMSDAINAQAFTHRQHIYFSSGAYQPGSQAGQHLLAHELSHTVQQGNGAGANAGISLWRRPKGATAEVTLGEPEIIPQPKEEWIRAQVVAVNMDLAAQKLAQEQFKFTGAENRELVFIGLHPDFIKIYNKDGRALARIPLKKIKGLQFNPGIYVQFSFGLVALTTSTLDPTKYGLEGPQRSIIGTVPLTDKEKKEMAEEEKKAKAEKRAPKPPSVGVLKFEDAVTDMDKMRSVINGIPNALAIYFVPNFPASSGGKARGNAQGIYSSPIEGRDDGQPANAPPWPVEVEGPRLAPVDSDPTYSAKIHWEANGNYTVMDQAISQIGEDIHYKWELFDITQYAEKELAKDPAHTQEQTNAPPEKSLEQRVEEFKRSKEGSGKNVTGMGGANREFAREYEDWWKDTKRAAKGARDPSGDTVAEKLSNSAANRLSLELSAVSLLVTTLSAVKHWIADLFAGPRQEQQVPLKKKGYFLLRLITTPAINEDREGKPIIRPPSVNAKIVEVTPIEKAVTKSLDEPKDQMDELQAQIDDAEKAGNQSKADYLRSLLAEARQRFEGSPLTLLVQKRKQKQEELDEFHKNYPILSTYSRQHEIDMLDDQIALYRRHEGELGPGRSLTRVNATLISEVTAEQYPLLISAAEMEAKVDGVHRWMISDVTNRSGKAFIGEDKTSSTAFHKALEKFGGEASYGRGRIGVRTTGLGMEAGAPEEMQVDSAPTDWSIAEKRIEDLVTVLVAIGLMVSSAGAAGALIGAGLAAAKLIERWRAGTLYLNDPATLSDMLSLLGGIGVAGELGTGVLRGLRVQKFEKMFAVVQDGKATADEINAAVKALQSVRKAENLARAVELANEAINYSGLVWGNVSFIDQMMEISYLEQQGLITHTAARRQRADAVSSAVQNNGLFIAGNVKKAMEKSKAAAKEPAAKQIEKQTSLQEKDTLPADKQPSPAEKQPPEESVPEEGNKPAQKAGDPVPLGERQATLEELRAALPPDLRSLVEYDTGLEGDHVQAEYKLDEKTGLISEIKLKCSRDARPDTVSLHEQTIRTMQKYQGFGGRVRQAITWVQELLGFTPETPNPENRASFEAALEVQKLPGLIKNQMERMKNMGPNARAEADAELDHLRSQLEENLFKLDLGEGTEATGFVAKKGLSKAKLKEYNRLLEELRPLEPGTDAHRKIRRQMYELAGGDLPLKIWNKVYDANVERANKANEAVTTEQERLGWGQTEQTVNVGKGQVRRLDIASVKSRKGVEVKEYETGTIYASDKIVSEVERDAQLVKKGWDIKWILIDTEPSAPLRDKLLDAGIRIEIRTRKSKSETEFERMILPPKKRGG